LVSRLRRIAQRSTFAASELFWQVERVTAQHVDVLKAERPDSLDVLWADRQAYLLQLLQRSFDVARVPANDGIDDKTQRPMLVLLSFTVALAQFTALAVEDGTGKTMTAFTAVELN